MRTIIVPAPLVLADGREFSFCDFVSQMLTLDRRFNSNARGAFAAERISTRIKAPLLELELELETTDGDLLKEVCAEPTDGYPIKPAHVAAAFLRAVAEQTEK